MIRKVDRNSARLERHTRVRNKVLGTSNVPRLNVFRSNSNIFAQIIDDEASKTLVSASSIDKELKLENGGNVEAAGVVAAGADDLEDVHSGVHFRGVVPHRGGAAGESAADDEHHDREDRAGTDEYVCCRHAVCLLS